MHRIFTVSDLLAQICDVLLKEDDDRASVACLARTNTLLSVPCFSALWRKLDCIYPLLNTLPSTTIDLSSRWRLLRHPTLTDWSRALYYGAFVRSIHYDPQRNPIHRSLLYDILASLRIRPSSASSPDAVMLLPNLTHASIVWRLATPESFAAYHLFLPPTLLSTSVNAIADPTYTLEHQHRSIFAEWLGIINLRCPLIEEIHTSCRWGAIMALRPAVNVQSTLPHFPNLCALTTVLAGAYTARFIGASSAQPRLKRLSFVLNTAAIMPDSLGEDFYPFLESAELEGYNQKCFEFLTLLAPRPPPRLTSMTLTCLSLEQPQSEFFKALARAVPPQTLRSLRLSFHPNYGPTSRTTLPDIIPLFVLEELRELRIQAGNPFHISSAELETIGAGLPKLRALCLNSPVVEDGGNAAGTAFEWHAVVALARICVSLTELSVPLDFDTLPSPSPATSPRVSTSSYGERMFDDLDTPSSTSEEESFPNLESFLLNDLPTFPQPLLIPPPPPTASQQSQPPLLSHLPSTLPVSPILPIQPSPNPFHQSRPASSSRQKTQYAAFAMLFERVFPRATLGLHISRFEKHEEQQRMERFESVQSVGSGRSRRRRK